MCIKRILRVELLSTLIAILALVAQSSLSCYTKFALFRNGHLLLLSTHLQHLDIRHEGMSYDANHGRYQSIEMVVFSEVAASQRHGQFNVASRG